MRRWLGVACVVLAWVVPSVAAADCPSECVFTCSAGPAEDYVTCLDACLEGCSPAPVPEPSPPAPVEPSTGTTPSPTPAEEPAE